ncbi:hypothetical protein PENTCL1PPCAC_5523, partial [Pristionchus entomophagus]
FKCSDPLTNRNSRISRPLAYLFSVDGKVDNHPWTSSGDHLLYLRSRGFLQLETESRCSTIHNGMIKSV